MCSPIASGISYISSMTDIDCSFLDIDDLSDCIYAFSKLSLNDLPKKTQQNEIDFNGEGSMPVKIYAGRSRYECKPLTSKSPRGAFGAVLFGYNNDTMEEVAVKLIAKQAGHHHFIMSELEVLRALQQTTSPYIMRFFDGFVVPSHMVFVTEKLEITVYDAIRSNILPLGLNTSRMITSQMLSALEELESLNIAHCDIKLDNVMISTFEPFVVKLIDFGQAIIINDMRKPTHKVQTSRVRAPEVVFRSNWSISIDMWSLGCMSFQCTTGNNLFTATDENHLIQEIYELIGAPTDLSTTTNTFKEYFAWSDDKNAYIPIDATIQTEHTRPLSKLEYMINDEAHITHQYIDFLRRVLTWDPSIRITPSDALLLPFFSTTQL